MANREWSLQGIEFVACNCDWGCPCQFNALPTNGNCEAVVAMRIDRGKLGEVSLDGLCWVATFAWPRAIHEGNGRAQVFVDERADARQREALLTILSGQETDEGATVFQVFAGTIGQMFEPQFVPIEFSADYEKRIARVAIPGVLESTGEPIRNPATGAEHRARINLPRGFEYDVAEVASASFHTRNEVAVQSTGTHGHFAKLNMTGHGVVH